MHAPTARAIVFVGVDDAKPAPGVLEAIAERGRRRAAAVEPGGVDRRDPGVPGVRQALVDSPAPVVGLSPIVGAAPVRGMADKVLAAVGVPVTAAAVALHYGADLLDGWLVDLDADAGDVADVEAGGIACRAVPLLMSSPEATTAMARATLDFASELAAR